MKDKHFLYFIDSLVVFFNIAAGRGNILLYWLTGFHDGGRIQALVIVLDFLYILLRFGGSRKKRLYKIPKTAILILIILFVNLINIMLEGKANPLAQLIQLLLCVLFVFVLYNISNDYSSDPLKDTPTSQFLSRGYVWLSLISVFGVFISFFLASLFGPGNTLVDVDFLGSHLDKGDIYYRTYFSMNLFTLFGRVPFFHDYGMLCGLFHEPHLLDLNVLPCLILLLGFTRKAFVRWGVGVSIVLILLFAGSATGLLVAGGCLALFFIINSKKHLVASLVGAGAIVLIVLAYNAMDDTLLQFVLGRIDEDNGSHQYSTSLLEWTFSPRTLMGSNFFATDYVNELTYSSVITKDVGFIPFGLYIAFLFFYLKDTIKLIFSKDKVGMAVGFASLYMIIHSAKIGMTLFALTYPFLIVMIQTVVLKEIWKKQAS